MNPKKRLRKLGIRVLKEAGGDISRAAALLNFYLRDEKAPAIFGSEEKKAIEAALEQELLRIAQERPELNGDALAAELIRQLEKWTKKPAH